MDPAEAQLLGEISRYRPHTSPTKPSATSGLRGDTTMADEYDDGYDTDPPAHYPKPGNGLARTLKPDKEDWEYMVDDNYEAFSHGWKGDGTGVGANAVLGAWNTDTADDMQDVQFNTELGANGSGGGKGKGKGRK